MHTAIFSAFAARKMAIADEAFMAVAHDGTPFITIYKRSGDTFTKLANPATLPASNGLGVAFYPRAF